MKKVLLFMLLVPVLAELLSGNSPLPIFLSPIFFLIQVLVYGVPVVLIREATVRWNLGLKGLFLLGISYGLFNEGVIAKTLANSTNLLGTFASSQFIAGLNPYWVVYVSIWHALHSVIFPILVIQYFYPSWEPWLSKKMIGLFSLIVVFGFTVGLSLGNKSEALISTILIVLLLALAKTGNKKLLTDTRTSSTKSFWIGICTIFGAIGGIMLAKVVSFPVFLVYEIIVLSFFYFLLKRAHLLSPYALLLFALGEYIAFGLFIMIGGPWIIIGNSLVIIFLLIFRKRALRATPENDLRFANL